MTSPGTTCTSQPPGMRGAVFNTPDARTYRIKAVVALVEEVRHIVTEFHGI